MKESTGKSEKRCKGTSYSKPSLESSGSLGVLIMGVGSGEFDDDGESLPDSNP